MKKARRTLAMTNLPIINLLEVQIRAIISEAGLRPLATALHNACAHGEVLDCTDEALEELYKVIEALIAVIKKHDI